MQILRRYELHPCIFRLPSLFYMHKVYIQYQLFPFPTSLFPLMSGTPRRAAKEVRIIKRLRVWAWRWLMDCYREEMRQAAWGSWVAKQTSTLDNETLEATRVESRHTSLPLLSPPRPTLTSLQSNCTWARLSYLIYGVWPVLLPAFFSSCNKIFKLFSGICNLKDSRTFFLCSLSRLCCCCLPEFNVNPPQTVRVMSTLCACACTRASVPC